MEYQATSRRQFVALATIGAVGLSGCLGDEEAPEEEPEEEPEESEEAYDVNDQPEDAAVSFVAPEDGATVSSPVEFEAEVEGIELASVDNEQAVGEGHLHLLINGEPFEDTEAYETGEVIPGPADQVEEEDGIFHWSDGQSEDEVDLEPGEYTVIIQIGDTLHQAFGETDEITITVEDDDE